MDSLAPVLSGLSLSARVFFTGELCRNTDFYDQPTLGFVHLLRRGELTVVDDQGTRTTLTEPAVVFFSGASGHGLLANKRTHPDLVCATIEFGATVGNPLVRALPSMMVLPLHSIVALTPTMDLLFAEADGRNVGRQSALDRLAEYFVLLLLRHAMSSSTLHAGWLAALTDARLGKALAVLHASPEKRWTLASLAKQASMSRARFAAQFRKLVGTPPLEYLTAWRMSVAQELLKQGKPLKLIAPAVGYGSATTFSRVYAKRLGSVPSSAAKETARYKRARQR